MGGSSGILRRPAVPPPVRIRRNIVGMRPDDPIVTFFGRAIAEMRRKPLADPTSWRYQAAIHDYPTRTPPVLRDGTIDNRPFDVRRREEDPFFSPGDVFPADENDFWRTCEHGSWFFLPWHRMYLHHFEKMILDHVTRLGGPTDWALPYWNYSAGPASETLPAALRDASTGLRIEQRTRRANLGQPFFTSGALNDANPGSNNISLCLRETVYRGVPRNAGFGGLPPARHDGAGLGKGRVESSPHDQMHGAINGQEAADARNFMGSFTRAPLDPVFWIHHCNIDRLWEVWIRRGNTNPVTSDWRDPVFKFHDFTGGNGDLKPAQVVDTRVAPLSYEYDDTSDPLAP